MLDVEKIKEHLSASGKINPEQLKEAEEYALDKRISLAKALVDLKIADYSFIGECFSSVSELPYVPLISRCPSPHAKSQISLACAEAWKVFPSDYDNNSHVLTLAISDPERIVKIEHIDQFFMQPRKLAFTIACEAEIKEAIKKHLKIEVPLESKKSSIQKPVKKTSDSKPKKKQTLSGLHRDAQKTPAASVKEKEKAEIPNLAYAEMNQALVSAVAALARLHLGDDSGRLSEIRSRVRYCQLLASRLNLLPIEIDATILAAWLSVFEDKPEVAKQLVNPYKLEEILFVDHTQPETLRMEARVLSLVKCYQGLKVRDPDICREVNLTRRNLRLLWSSSSGLQDMLEKFLQLLMDEEFLASVDKRAGRILIVDPAEMSTANLAPPLSNNGYDVSVVPDASAADQFIRASEPDLIIANIDLPQESGLKFCSRIKTMDKTSGIPFIMLIDHDEENHAAECLRAGADDFVTKPIDLEVLFLKMQRVAAASPAEKEKQGVSGSLDEMNFTDMIQILCAGKKSMEIVLTRGKDEGRVYVLEGEIIHARAGDVAGEKAFYHLMRWQEGNFTTAHCSEFPDRTITSSTMALLMEGSRLVDESH